MTSHKIRWRRRSPAALLAVLIAAVLAPMAVTAAPAHADPTSIVISLCDRYPQVCRPMLVARYWPPVDCPCGVMLDWRFQPSLPDYAQSFLRAGTVNGMQLLNQASVATDPAAVAGLRNGALSQFTAAANYTMGVGMTAGPPVIAQPGAGPAGPPWRVFAWPSAPPALEASAADIADGIGWLKRAIAEPGMAAQYKSLAMGQFDEAHTEFTQLLVIAG